VSDIKGVPEVVDWADLAREPGRELLQDQVDLAEDLPIAGRPGRVVARVLGVVGEMAVGVGQVEGVGWAMVSVIPSSARAWRVWS
jgi:hypothetical protein